MTRFPREALVAGIIAGALFVAGITSLIGPIASDSPREMAAALANGRFWALLALFGVGLSTMFGVWFLTLLRSWLRSTAPSGGEELGTAALVGGALATGLALVGMSLFYGATYKLAERGGSAAVLGLVDAANAAMMLTKFPGALVIAAVSVAMGRAGFPRWFVNLGIFSVAVLIFSSIGLFTTDHFTQFGGPLDFYGTLPAALWAVALMVLLHRDPASASPPLSR